MNTRRALVLVAVIAVAWYVAHRSCPKCQERLARWLKPAA